MMRQSLPQVSGEISVRGLKGAVTVDRDAHGVPHIRAESMEDLLVAQGYVLAQDRLFQMDLIRRSAAGELSEVLGEPTVALDKESRILGLRQVAEAAVAALPSEGKDALVALFEIGADTTSLKVLRDDEMLYDRDQAFGGSQLTQLISRQYGFSYEEAEQKKLAADLPEDYESTLLAPFVDSLSQEIGRALQYFFTSTPHHKVHYVMLAGGTATHRFAKTPPRRGGLVRVKLQRAKAQFRVSDVSRHLGCLADLHRRCLVCLPHRWGKGIIELADGGKSAQCFFVQRAQVWVGCEFFPTHMRRFKLAYKFLQVVRCIGCCRPVSMRNRPVIHNTTGQIFQ